MPAKLNEIYETPTHYHQYSYNLCCTTKYKKDTKEIYQGQVLLFAVQHLQANSFNLLLSPGFLPYKNLFRFKCPIRFHGDEVVTGLKP